MKKLIFIISLLSACDSVIAQTWYRANYSNGVPTANPSVATVIKYSSVDTVNGHGYLWNNTQLKWVIADGIIKGTKGDKGDAGAQGIQGVQGIQGIQGIQGDPGIQGQAGLIGPIGATGLTGPQGIQGLIGLTGPQGPPGTGTLAVFITPEQYGACHCSTGSTDADAIQAAVTNAGGKTLVLYGTYYLSHGIVIPKNVELNQIGDASMQSTNANTWTMWGKDNPSGISEATSTYLYYPSHFRNLRISLQGQQIGFNTRASMGSSYDHIITSGGAWGFRSEFQLKAQYNFCEANAALNGVYIGIGSFTGATIYNSQSNISEVNNLRCWSVSGTALYIDNSYEIGIKNLTVEGNGTCQYGLYVDFYGNTTAKNISLDYFHGEQIGGCTGAWIYAKLRDGTIHLSNLIAHYPGLMVDVQSATGAGVAVVEYFHYAVGDANGKHFNLHGNARLQLNWCQGFTSTNTTLWCVAPVPTYCASTTGACGTNTFGLLSR